jgi:hypothetical protein
MDKAVRRLGLVRRRWDRAAAAFATLLAAGLGMVVAGWVIQGSDYLPGLLLQVGSSVDLVAPLFVLNRYMERRLRRTEEHTAGIAASLGRVQAGVDRAAVRLDQLDAVIAGARDSGTDAVLSAAALLADEVSRGIVAEALAKAEAAGAISRDGIRVRIQQSTWRLRFRSCTAVPGGPVTQPFAVELEDAAAQNRVLLRWPEGTGPEVLIIAVIRALEANRDHLAAAGIGGAALYGRLSANLLQAVRLSRRPERPAVGGVLEIVNDQWAVAANGLIAVDLPYLVPRARIAGSREDWVGYLSQKDWVDQAKIREAEAVARDLFAPQRSSGN